MKFTPQETRDLWAAGLLLSLAFAILLAGGYDALITPSLALLIAFIVAFFTAGLGFLLHELMHKLVAQRFGLFAQFQASYNWLWLALLFSLFGFIIAAPGAVFIQGFGLTKERNGKISLAGPATNIVLAIIFLALLFTIPTTNLFLSTLFSFGLTINSLLAAFNMIPTVPFDGAKIIAWDKKVYFITLILAVGLFVTSFFV